MITWWSFLSSFTQVSASGLCRACFPVYCNLSSEILQFCHFLMENSIKRLLFLGEKTGFLVYWTFQGQIHHYHCSVFIPVSSLSALCYYTHDRLWLQNISFWSCGKNKGIEIFIGYLPCIEVCAQFFPCRLI